MFGPRSDGWPVDRCSTASPSSSPSSSVTLAAALSLSLALSCFRHQFRRSIFPSSASAVASAVCGTSCDVKRRRRLGSIRSCDFTKMLEVCPVFQLEICYRENKTYYELAFSWIKLFFHRRRCAVYSDFLAIVLPPPDSLPLSPPRANLSFSPTFAGLSRRSS